MAENSIFTILFVINTAFLALLLWDKEEGTFNFSPAVHDTEIDAKPYIIFSKDGVDVTFKNPNVEFSNQDADCTRRDYIPFIE